jgi:hypothetical protein
MFKPLNGKGKSGISAIEVFMIKMIGDRKTTRRPDHERAPQGFAVRLLGGALA